MKKTEQLIGSKIIIIIITVLFGTYTKADQTILPWEKIIEKLEKNENLSRNIDIELNNLLNEKQTNSGINPDSNYSYQQNDIIKIEMEASLLKKLSSEKKSIEIEKYKDGSWVQTTEFIFEIKESGIIIEGIKIDGFYKISTKFNADSKDISDFTSYFIVCNNWKKDILALCRILKEEIELNPDDQLFRSSIAISHIDKCMKTVSVSNDLSGKILNILKNAITSKKAFDNGDCPDLLVDGLNKIRIKRFNGSQINQFVVFIPDEYDSTKKWPVLMHPDPKQEGAKNKYKTLSGLIDIWWVFDSLKEYEWKDYEFFINILKEKLNIDEDKVYLYGWCDNSIAAMALSVKHPDHWAECGFVVGNSFRHLIGNLYNIPIIYVNTIYQEGDVAGYFNFGVKCFTYFGCKDFQYNWEQVIPQFGGYKEPLLLRENNPHRILYSIDSLSNQNAYWIRIDGRINENLTGTIDTCVWGQTVLVKTKNVDAYTLKLAHAPLDVNRPIEIIENGQSIAFVKDNIFTKKSEKYQNVTSVKNNILNGPVWDVFTDPYVIVWGSKLPAEMKRVVESLSNGAPSFSDSNFPDELIDSHNIVLIGTSESNSWLEKISGQLPVKMESDQIIANSKKYDNSDMGCILVYPNPMNSNKYVAIFSGTSKKAINQLPNAYSQMKSIRPADVGIFKVAEDNSIKWFVLEKFDTVWNWHNEWEQVLSNIEKKHPKWQWHQWFAKAIKKQLNVDVVICEDPFLFESSELAGQITYRDIFNFFRNDWILKIEIKGSDLKNFLAVPFKDITKRTIDNLVIEGVSLVASKQSTDIGIGDLESDKVYKVALPEKCLNGQRIGVELKDYKIIEDDHVISLLKEYLNDNSDSNIDAQLDSIKPKIY